MATSEPRATDASQSAAESVGSTNHAALGASSSSARAPTRSGPRLQRLRRRHWRPHAFASFGAARFKVLPISNRRVSSVAGQLGDHTPNALRVGVCNRGRRCRPRARLQSWSEILLEQLELPVTSSFGAATLLLGNYTELHVSRWSVTCTRSIRVGVLSSHIFFVGTGTWTTAYASNTGVYVDALKHALTMCFRALEQMDLPPPPATPPKHPPVSPPPVPPPRRPPFSPPPSPPPPPHEPCTFVCAEFENFTDADAFCHEEKWAIPRRPRHVPRDAVQLQQLAPHPPPTPSSPPSPPGDPPPPPLPSAPPPVPPPHVPLGLSCDGTDARLYPVRQHKCAEWARTYYPDRVYVVQHTVDEPGTCYINDPITVAGVTQAATITFADISASFSCGLTREVFNCLCQVADSPPPSPPPPPDGSTLVRSRRR